MKNSLEGHKIQEIKVPYKISLSLSDTQTHIHIGIQPHPLRHLQQRQKTYTENKN